jgi:glutamate-1-semialdehyde 2,1-aminomutase
MQGAGHHGVIAGDVAGFVRIPWNDAEAFARVLAEHPGQVAGFIATPYHHPTFADSELPAEGYWQRMRELCDREGVVLIIDDVRCGFRLSLRGSADFFGFTPDLACYCKAIANGYPISAIVGTEALKGAAAKVFYTGSYWYQAAPMAAALACLAELERLDASQRMQDYGRALTDGMKRLADQHGYELKVSGVPSMPYLRLTDDPSLMLHQRFIGECARRGAYMTSHHNWFMSCAHTQDDLDHTLAIVEDAFTALEKSPEGQGGS